MTTIDWSGPGHWSPDAAPCRWCRFPTQLRDTAGRPAHKACVEKAFDDLKRRRLTSGPDREGLWGRLPTDQPDVDSKQGAWDASHGKGPSPVGGHTGSDWEAAAVPQARR